jgi:hypothetical protein
MAIGRINGPMLTDNLERQGNNIALDANLTYWDVNNRYVGINTTTPNYPLDVHGNAHVGNIYIQGNTVTTDPGLKLNLGSVANLVITGGAANTILYTDGTGALSFLSLPSVISTSGFTANGILLGTSQSIGYVGIETFSANTTVTNSILQLNQDLGNAVVNITAVSGSVYSNANASAYFTTFSGNIHANIITANTFNGNINGTTASFSNISGTILTANQPYISNIGTLGNLTVTSNISAGNIVTSWDYYGNIVADTITPYKTQVTVFNSNTAIGLPSGTSFTRPSNPLGGYFRYNTDYTTIEYYNGLDWTPLNSAVIDQQLSPDGINNSFTLSQNATESGLIVSINGTVQRPGVSYTVSGNTITFAEVPQVSDFIDVRFIASVGLTTLDFAVVNTPTIEVDAITAILDSFPASTYRGAKYILTSSNGTDTFMAEVMLLQNGGTVVLNTYGVLATGTNTLSFDANVNGPTVNLLATGTIASNQVRLQRIYFDI